MESLGIQFLKSRDSIENENAENIIKRISKRKDDRWETGLLWRDEKEVLPESKQMALHRFNFIERKMIKNDMFSQAYIQKIEEYEEKGYAKKLSKKEVEEISHKTWYLPHFAVFNPNKPGKLRFVFDAAAKVEGKSLNDFLMKGPDLYNSLISILSKFREKRIAFCADIKEMFHQVLIRKEDQNAQRFFFRKSPSEELETYVMQVMIFGAVCSSYSAQYIKNTNALEFQKVFPEAVDAILHRHYMDDYLDSSETPEEAIRLINDVIMIHRAGGFELRGWVCNSQEVFETLPVELRNTEKTFGDCDTSQRILGLKWEPKEDVLSFPLNLHKIDKELILGHKLPSKRQLLKVIMSLFDPLGFLGHYLVKAKILMQDVWRSGIEWDQQIKDSQFKKWKNWLKGLEKIRTLKIPRCYNLNYKYVNSLELHVFCDASEQAYSEVAYFRFELQNNIHISLVMSKNQVSPLKSMTIPRKELQAALIASRLAKTIKNCHSLELKKIIFWSDSMVVLGWLRSEMKKFPSFIGHRVGEILESTDVSQWRWIPSKVNVADEATRDDKEADLSSESRWFKGPKFLYQPRCFWPREDLLEKNVANQENYCTQETTETILLSDIKEEMCLPDITKFSSYLKLLRSTAYVLRFLETCQKKRETCQKEICCEELKLAEKMWILKIQKKAFLEEYKLLSKGKTVSRQSRIYRLSPILIDGIICINGRLDNSPDLGVEAKRPIILDNNQKFTKLLIENYHKKNKHAGVELVYNEIRQRFWIIHARKSILKIINDCNFCKIRYAKPVIPEMGKLPIERSTKPPRAFFYTGIDYFGPIEVALGRRREKKYGVLFTCLSLRAVHIEKADSLDTDSALLAIRRFIARRGQPCVIWSDNGTNLTKANKEIKEALKNLDSDLIERKLVAEEIQWKFIPPASPHMGGAWERLVRSIKQTLKTILKERTPKYEVLHTLMLEAEHTVNSRPLTYISTESDVESLTPNHFLLGTSSISKPMGIFPERLDLRKQWRYSQQLAENFWNRWIKEYLPTLLTRAKWLTHQKNVQAGEIVVVMDNQLPRNNWPLGKIVKVYTGSDGKVRIVDVKTKTGTYRRPIAKLCPVNLLEMSNSEDISGGRNVDI